MREQWEGEDRDCVEGKEDSNPTTEDGRWRWWW